MEKLIKFIKYLNNNYLLILFIFYLFIYSSIYFVAVSFADFYAKGNSTLLNHESWHKNSSFAFVSFKSIINCIKRNKYKNPIGWRKKRSTLVRSDSYESSDRAFEGSRSERYRWMRKKLQEGCTSTFYNDTSVSIFVWCFKSRKESLTFPKAITFLSRYKNL